MAATQRATSPHTEPFPALENAPRTPTSLPSVRNIPTTNGGPENPNLLRPLSSTKSDLTIADIPPKSDKPGLTPRFTPVPLTGAAAMADLKKRKQQKEAAEARQTSPNPAVEAMQSLMGATGGMSKASDAPSSKKLSEPLQKVAEKMDMTGKSQGSSQQTSPVSLSSYGTIESTGANSAMTATASDAPTPGPQFVAEPGEMHEEPEPDTYADSNGNLRATADSANKAIAFSYPGPPPQREEQNQEGGPSRGMSLPGYGQSSPKSPSSNKRHKCPYCSTDFTRHHNLKSHLLTHSQEKPYVCQTCQARFRRLHDLKRHTKLHTGERPHNCEKCGRRFARGDALARHNKGPGGCAGRRSSFGGDDDGNGADGMTGVEYTGEDGEDEFMDAQGRRVSEPHRKRAHLETPQDTDREVYRQHSSTYPPVQSRSHAGSVGSMGPPQVVLPSSSTATSPRDLSGQPSPHAGSSVGGSSYYNAQGTPGQMFAQQNVMTESPKPLSPGQPPDGHRLSVADHNANSAALRNRSPSLTTQFQQAHFGRGSGGRTPPQPPSQFVPHSGAPQLPILPGMGTTSQPQGRPGLQPSLGGPGPSMLQHQSIPPPPGQGSNPGSLSSHGRSSGSSIRDMAGQTPDDLWNYVRAMDGRFSRICDEYELRISRLQEEVIGLKGQLSTHGSYSSDMQSRY